MDTFNPNSLRLPDVRTAPSTDTKKPPRHKTGGKFLKGPVPWDWISMAAKLPGKALHVSIVLWFLAGVKNSRTIILSSTALKGIGVKRNAAYRGLAALEESGLVSVVRHRGRCPVVTINACPEKYG